MFFEPEPPPFFVTEATGLGEEVHRRRSLFFGQARSSGKRNPYEE
jgi:hypothetical protein